MQMTHRWGHFVHHDAARGELLKHARRMARLHRAQVLTREGDKLKSQTKLLERVEKLMDLERDRHAKRMQQLAKVQGIELPKAPEPATAGSAEAR
jgi:hypothetical protein